MMDGGMMDGISKLNASVTVIKGDKPSIDSYILSEKENKQNLSRLIEIYSPNKCVPFLGAGVSKDCGIRTWADLICDLRKNAESIGWKPNGDFLDVPESYPDIAEEIYKYYESSNIKEAYFSILAKNMTPWNQSTTLLLVKLILAFRTILTTNFDDSINSATDFLTFLSNHCKFQNKTQPNLLVLPDFEQHKQDRVNIYHLHGYKGSSERGPYILRRSEYSYWYPSVSKKDGGPDLEACIKKFYKSYNIIFVGFSFQDQCFRKFFFNLKSRIAYEENELGIRGLGGMRQREHFLLIDEDTKEKWDQETGRRQDFWRFFKEYDVYPIVYQKGQHIFLEYLLSQLLALGPEYVK